jgi:hypothetical protein
VAAPVVAEALRRSRTGSFVSRGWRELRGKRLRIDLPVRVVYSRAAVGSVVAGVARTLARSPRNAVVRTSATAISFRPGRDGLRVLRAPLERALVSRLVERDAPPTIAIPSRTLLPRVTNEQLHRKFGTFIGVSREQFRLRLFKDFRLVKTYVVSIGRVGYETEPGLYHVRSKVVNPNWIVPNEPWAGSLQGRVIPGGSPENPIKARWLGFHGGAGVHGTDDVWSLGHAASHGCIRMSIPDVEDLYERVPLGAPIYIG